jgi:hypothetical protein
MLSVSIVNKKTVSVLLICFLDSVDYHELVESGSRGEDKGLCSNGRFELASFSDAVEIRLIEIL